MEINQNEEKLKEQYNYNLEEVNEVVLNITNKRSAQKELMNCKTGFNNWDK